MASGFAPGAIGQPAQAPAMLAPKKKPSVLGQVEGAQATTAKPITSMAPPTTGGLQTALGGVTAVNPTNPVLKPGTPGPAPVTGAPVAAAPFPVGAPAPTAPAPLNLEQTLTNQFQTGAPANPRLGATQGLVDQAAQGLSSGPNRTDIAKQAFTDYLSQSGDQFNKDIRGITQRSAAAGRLGSGMYGSDLVDAATTADKNRTYAGNQLAQDLANGTISDQFNRVGVLGNLEGQQSGQAQQSLQNLLGYGQQSFNNQITNQQQQQSIDDQQFRQLIAMLQLQGG